jgi:hypothetical protein
MWILKAIGAVLLLAMLLVAGFVYDAGWNDGRMVATLLGRDRLVAQCLPAVRTRLADRGFSPTDVEVGEPVSIALASGSFGRSRILSGPFTFSDGPNGPRVDGRLVCRVQGAAIEVQVDVDGLPLRAA